MISTSFGFIASVFALLAAYFWFSGKVENFKFFKVIPPLIIAYIIFILCSHFGLWSYAENSPILDTKQAMMDYGVPLLIFTAVVQSDARKMLKLGPKLLTVYVLTCVSIILGMVVSAVVFASKLNIPEMGATMGAVTGSFIGGPENLYAVANVMNLSDGGLSNALLLIYVVFTPWMTMLIVLLPIIAKSFNRWTKADTTAIEEAAGRIDDSTKVLGATSAKDIFFILGIGMTLEAVSLLIGEKVEALIPSLSQGITMYLIVTVVSLLIGTYTKLGENPALPGISGTLAFVMLLLGCVGIDLGVFKDAGYFLATSATALLIHAVFMVIAAKIFKVDLFTLGCASIATIGGNSSAPVVATAYGNKAYITIAVVMAAIGPVIGTFTGLFVGRLIDFLV